MLRIAFTGGGSGGHTNPLLAVIEETRHVLDAPEADGTPYKLYYMGRTGIYTKEFVKNNVSLVYVPTPKLRRYFSLLNIVDIIKAPFALAIAFWHMFWIMPDVLFSKGGSGSLPVVIAARFFRVKIFIHESDTVPGLSNRIAYKGAVRVGISFKRTKKIWDDPKVALVGNPLRPFLLSNNKNPYKKKSKRVFGFDPELPLVLVMGGSLGSDRINTFLLDNLKDIVQTYQVLHVTGTNNFESFKAELAVAAQDLIEEQRRRYKIVGYLESELKDALVACDIAISRAGSGAIFELAYFQKPSILIPLKGSAGDHQVQNAYEYASSGACIIIEEDNLATSIFFAQLSTVLSDVTHYQQMSQAAGKFSRPQAGALIAKELIRLAKVRG